MLFRYLWKARLQMELKERLEEPGFFESLIIKTNEHIMIKLPCLFNKHNTQQPHV